MTIKSSSSTLLRPRRIVVNKVLQSEKVRSNSISTCKYNVFSFLPRFLFEQFRRYNNVFFFTTILMQQVPDVSPTGRFTTLVPFLTILSVSAIKEIFEDLRRRKMDIMVNNYTAEVLRNGKWTTTRWKNLKVGEIVKIEQDSMFPADLVILASSEEEGIAYIEMSNLDGETNLKFRQAHPFTAKLIEVERLNTIDAEIECEPPNVHVNEFNGTLFVNGERVSLDIGRLLLRGAKLKNTSWIYGVVVYAGHDARLLMNSKTAPLKCSSVDTLMNHRIIFLFITLITLAVLSALGAELYERVFFGGAWYLPPNTHLSIPRNIFAFFILYNNLIPISLQLCLELVRFFQASFINSDLQMYHEPTDTPANARTSNLNEELGQVKFLLTDKTGTLTCNVMKFKRCSVAGQSYGTDNAEEFDDHRLIEALNAGGPDAEQIREFLLMMASCHTVVPERTNDGEFIYQSSSSDEGALVSGANKLGFVFHTRRPHEIVVNWDGQDISLELLHVLEFTSDRKRMSIIIREADGAIKLYCKGADNIIMERLSRKDNSSETLRIFQRDLYEYSCLGYRTLCFAVSRLDDEFYAQWAKQFHAASISLEDREKRLADLAERVECDLRLIGVTAIEDKLQDHVPCTIRALLAADIRVWILTGDKRETAINIAQSSSLFTKKTRIMTLDRRSYNDVLADLEKFLAQSRRYTNEGVEFALVISGAALHQATSGEARLLFTELALVSHAVVCYRMTPMQKAQVVELVRQTTGQIVLGIGDGANDVAMIQSANVGVGITGEEGLQAASASDYSIGQFHFLRRLLFVHGTWNYDRSVKVIMYSFYKNICLYIIELWFAFFSAFSGQTIFDRWLIALFNIGFTAFPPVILGLFDRPMSAKLILRHPWLYHTFQTMTFSNLRFAFWIGMSLWHSLMLFFLSYGYFRHQVVWFSGLPGGWMMLGNSCYSFVILTVCLKALMECSAWTHVMWLSSLSSVLLWFFALILYSWLWPHAAFAADMAGMAWIMYTSITFWLALIFIPTTTLLTDFLIKSFSTNICPTQYERLYINERGGGSSDPVTMEKRKL